MKKDFDLRCYEALKKVPHGKVVTYKEIAKKLNSKGYRAVGNAMHRNPNLWISGPQTQKNKSRLSLSNKNSDLIHVHCYKVVRSDGKVGGYLKGVKKKIELLKRDGIVVINGRIDLNKFGFKL